MMATLTVEIPDALKERLDREVASGRFKDRNALVQMLLEAAMHMRWKEDAEQKIDEALDEVERGQSVAWRKGDSARMGREYLQEKRAREANS
jgi:Arc/MetJ-type ribon-helix-helix transcriptional regulator